MYQLPNSRLVASSCSSPKSELEPLLDRCAKVGFTKFEAFTSWAESALDIDKDPETYRALAAGYGIAFSSMHLPPVDIAVPSSLDRAVAAARFAQSLGVGVVLFKAVSRESYVALGRSFLDAIDGIGVTPVLQNHSGSPLTTLDHLLEVVRGINDDRMKTLLEVGHLHAAGQTWPAALEALDTSVRLVHIKDQIGAKPVPFGTGEIDLAGLFARLAEKGYDGNIVVEVEIEGSDDEVDRLQAAAIDFCSNLFTKDNR